MVLDDQLRPLHPLTNKGEKQYRQLLESMADEILFKHAHPIKWFFEKIKDFICDALRLSK